MDLRRRWGTFAIPFFIATFSLTAHLPRASAQDIKDELDALEDFPEDDVSSSAKSESSSSKSDNAKSDQAKSDSQPSSADKAPPDSADDIPPDEQAATPPPAATGDLANADKQTDKKPSDEDLTKDDGSDLEKQLNEAEKPPEENPPVEAEKAPETPPPPAPAPQEKAQTAPPPAKAPDADQELEQAINESAPTNPEEAMTGVSAEPAGKLMSLEFKQLPDRVRLVLKSDHPIDFSKEERSERHQIIVQMRNLSIGKSVLKRALDTGEFDGPVALVQAYDAKVAETPTVKVLFQLRKTAQAKLTRNGAELYVDFPLENTKGNIKAALEDKNPQAPESFMAIDGRTQFTGPRITLNVKDAEFADIINLLSKTSGKNFVLGNVGSPQKVTMNVRNVPWDQVLSMILFNNHLGYQQIGSVYRIVPVADLQKEIDDTAKAIANRQDLIPVETKLIPIGYSKATEIQSNIKDFLTKRGKSSVDARTNSLVVTDLPEVLDKIAQYIRSVDKQTAQVLIEGRIVEAREQFSRNLSVNWKIGEFTSGNLQDSFVNLGSAGNTLVPTIGNPSAVPGQDLTTTGTNGGIRLRVGNLGSIGAVTALIGVAESEDVAKIIGSPRVTVLNNKTATISQGNTIAIQTAGGIGGAGQVVFVPANLTLNVTPQVTSDGYVSMHVDLNNDEANGSTGSTITRHATTDMLVESGKTGVLGGIYTLDHEKVETGWPWLRAIPLLGLLFQDSSNTTNSTNELLMFLSPKILNPDKALVAYSPEEELKDNLDEEKRTNNFKQARLSPTTEPSSKASPKANLDDADFDKTAPAESSKAVESPKEDSSTKSDSKKNDDPSVEQLGLPDEDSTGGSSSASSSGSTDPSSPEKTAKPEEIPDDIL